MKNVHLFFAALIVAFSIPAKAQWTKMTSFNGAVRSLEVFDNNLYIVGNFTKREGNTCYWSTYYDGANFNNHTPLIGGVGLSDLEVFNGELYGAGGLIIFNNTGVSRWDGSTWLSASTFKKGHSGIFADGNDLYAGSSFGEISKKTGTGAFVAMPSMDEEDPINAFQKFNGEIIVGGEFVSSNNDTLNNIARWDGTAWQPLGTGLSSYVNCMTIYQGELYVGGRFETASGVNAKFIAKWNGSTWSDVGGITTGTGYRGVTDMLVHDGKLYIVGDFTEIGGISTRYAAVWDGSSWAGMGLAPEQPGYLSCIEVYNDVLYAGAFDSPEANFYRFGANTSIEKFAESKNLQLYPNPVQESLYIETDENRENMDIEVRTIDGKLIKRREYKFTDQLSIDCADLPKGVYLVFLLNHKSQSLLGKGKFIKN